MTQHTWLDILLEGFFRCDQMSDARIDISAELSPICSYPLRNLLADATLKLACDCGMNARKCLPHCGDQPKLVDLLDIFVSVLGLCCLKDWC